MSAQEISSINYMLVVNNLQPSNLHRLSRLLRGCGIQNTSISISCHDLEVWGTIVLLIQSSNEIDSLDGTHMFVGNEQLVLKLYKIDAFERINGPRWRFISLTDALIYKRRALFCLNHLSGQYIPKKELVRMMSDKFGVIEELEQEKKFYSDLREVYYVVFKNKSALSKFHEEIRNMRGINFSFKSLSNPLMRIDAQSPLEDNLNWFDERKDTRPKLKQFIGSQLIREISRLHVELYNNLMQKRTIKQVFYPKSRKSFF